jgi:hypothetical protein
MSSEPIDRVPNYGPTYHSEYDGIASEPYGGGAITCENITLPDSPYYSSCDSYSPRSPSCFPFSPPVLDLCDDHPNEDGQDRVNSARTKQNARSYMLQVSQSEAEASDSDAPVDDYSDGRPLCQNTLEPVLCQPHQVRSKRDLNDSEADDVEADGTRTSILSTISEEGLCKKRRVEVETDASEADFQSTVFWPELTADSRFVELAKQVASFEEYTDDHDDSTAILDELLIIHCRKNGKPEEGRWGSWISPFWKTLNHQTWRLYVDILSDIGTVGEKKPELCMTRCSSIVNLHEKHISELRKTKFLRLDADQENETCVLLLQLHELRSILSTIAVPLVAVPVVDDLATYASDSDSGSEFDPGFQTCANGLSGPAFML